MDVEEEARAFGEAGARALELLDAAERLALARRWVAVQLLAEAKAQAMLEVIECLLMAVRDRHPTPESARVLRTLEGGWAILTSTHGGDRNETAS